MTTVSRPRRGAGDQAERLAHYRRLRAWLRGQSDEDLLRLELHGGARSVWSTTGVANIDGEDVFVKRVPVTARELIAPHSTRNHFELPVFYQYGVGSAGFGPFREAAALEAVTSWVLQGESARFPLLYHQRLLPGGPQRRARDPKASVRVGRMSLEDYVGYWANSTAVAEMMSQRVAADHELWLFTEYLPDTVSDWLMAHQTQVDMVIDQMAEATAVLRGHGLVHFDAHLANVMTDGASLYLADFGLACSREFDLSATEQSFLARHPYYDLGLAVAYLGTMLAVHVGHATPEVKAEVDRACGLTTESDRFTIFMGLIDGARRVADLIVLAPEYLLALERFRDVNEYMLGFISRLQAGSDKSATYDDAELLARLQLAGAPGLA